ncbi:MAG: hypothetical protein ABJK37_09370 [Paraglaciecola sp.]|uniref:hypothetical protein n=1 Tax=Paraglaciecola sp. TaxID=1920173 RepID=UPI003299E51C
MKQVNSSVVLLISVDYSPFGEQRLPYLFRPASVTDDTCLQSRFVDKHYCHPNALGDCATADA